MIMRKCFIPSSILEMVSFLSEPSYISPSKVWAKKVAGRGQCVDEALIPGKGVGRSTTPLLQTSKN